MDEIFNAYESAKRRTIQGDFIDRFHSRYTIVLFLAILLILVSKQYDKDAINCWLPTQFSDDQENYIHQFCWINNTYYFPNEEDPDRFQSSSRYTIHYYQFILFILSGQIALFYIPSLLWKSIASDSGSYINKLLDSVDRSKVFSAEAAKAEEPEIPKFPLRTVSEEPLNESVISTGSLEKKSLLSNELADKFKNDFQHLKVTMGRSSSLKRTSSIKKQSFDGQPSDVVNMSPESPEFMLEQHKKRKNLRKNLKKKLGKVIIKPIRGVKNLALYYFGMKFFNMANVIFQIVGLRYIFGEGFWRYGYDYMIKVLNNEDPLFMSKQFPIVTICDYYVHQNLRRIHWNSSQCLLAINVLIEKFYVFIWLWLYILLFLTLFNILSWFLEIYSSTRTNFIFKYLRIKEKMHESWNDRYAKSNSFKIQESYINDTVNSETQLTKQNVKAFHQEYLGYDGLVMMHTIKAVAGDMIFIELLNSLWMEYKRKKVE